MSRRLAALLSSLALAGGSVIGVREGTEEPRYSVAGHIGEIEIRQYGPRIAAETTLDGDEDAARSAGFRRIAGYIFGGNKQSAKIAMTAPVAQSAETIAVTAPVSQSQDAQGQWVVRFFMPSSYTMATLPVPDDDRVRLVEVPGETMAVLRFTGIASVIAMSARREGLLAALRGSSWQPIGVPVAWYYDPPWTIPFLRRNEVAVPVAPTK
jgi:hypothetical protein